MNYTFKTKCDEPSCNDGTMDYDRDGFDGPSAAQHTCWECDGQGWSRTFENHYSSEAELKVEYRRVGYEVFDIEVDTGQYDLSEGFTHARLK